MHFRVKCRLIQQFATIQVNSISEINAAVQFALASSGHSEGCHHIRLLQPRLNAVQQNLHSGMPNGDKLGFTKFQISTAFQQFLQSATLMFGLHCTTSRVRPCGSEDIAHFSPQNGNPKKRGWQRLHLKVQPWNLDPRR